MKTSEEIENLAKDLFIRETGSNLNHNNDYIIDLMVKTYKLAKSEKHTLKELCNQDNDLKNEIIEFMNKSIFPHPKPRLS